MLVSTRHLIRCTSATSWGLSLWGLAHLADGLLRIPDHWPHDDTAVLYDLWLIPGQLRYDQFVHAIGFGLTTWLCWQALRSAPSSPRPSPPWLKSPRREPRDDAWFSQAAVPYSARLTPRASQDTHEA